ncbi:MAG: hypothetical protein ACI3XP_00560 [Eubacteriales bacterium]
MKRICILFVILCILTSCDSTIYDIPEVMDTEQKDYHFGETEFSFAESDDRALNTTNRMLFAPGNIRYADGVMYMTSGSMIYRYDIEDGGVISLCIDPLCMHKDADCPFYGITGTNVAIHQNKVYYKREYFVHQTDSAGNVLNTEIKREYVCFDIDSRKLSVLDTWETGAYIESEYFQGDYRYYLHTIIGENNRLTYSINREHLTTRKVETLLGLDEWIAGIVHTDGNSVWLSDGTGIYRFSIKTPGQLDKIHTGKLTDTCFSEGYFYGIQEKQILRLDAQTGEATIICSLDFSPVNLCMTHDYLYFRPDEKVSYGQDKKQNAGQEIFFQTSDIYRVSVNGGNTEHVYSLSEEMKNYYIGNFLVDGNYLYAQYGYCDTEASEYYESWNKAGYDFIRIDLRNGEIYYIAE